MARSQIQVPYGYDPPKASFKGTLLVYDTFEDWTSGDIRQLADWAIERKFALIVLFPQHEETLRRMGIASQAPYYQRVKNLELMIQELQVPIRLEMDFWEGKRKKYTPIDTSLHFLTEKCPAPYFVWMNDRYANLFAGYSTFEEWIKKLRLVIGVKFQLQPDPKLLSFTERWETFDPASI
jgi:nicotinic acid mononucleotide adenylyltransferase